MVGRGDIPSSNHVTTLETSAALRELSPYSRREGRPGGKGPSNAVLSRGSNTCLAPKPGHDLTSELSMSLS
jgi:hypothetical protein